MKGSKFSQTPIARILNQFDQSKSLEEISWVIGK